MAQQTFRETYAAFNDPEDMDLYISQVYAPNAIRNELSGTGGRYYLADLDGQPVGFVKLREEPVRRLESNKQALEIQRLYVLKDYQGYQVGRALMDHVKGIAREEGFAAIWLQVWQKNQKAIRFYQTAGFVVYNTAPFQLGKDVQSDFLMKYDLYL